ncbi:hypothetical protein [Flammeovirga sp. SJP92]|uniref:hypothetical protein n=1 Tax=Flammeovirga sp. SJP92 TaxID=1775430 RepID=UPI000788E375|nr:hypothetical protein [Flammeovirga sp. SJP92]KXX69748.1 hypothetical protein AVL50_12715 [Flammeovirga sp. SJP92]
MKNLIFTIVTMISFGTYSNAQQHHFSVGEQVINIKSRQIYEVTKVWEDGKIDLVNTKTGNSIDAANQYLFDHIDYNQLIATQTEVSKPDALDYTYDYGERIKGWRIATWACVGGAFLGGAVGSPAVASIAILGSVACSVGILHTNPIRKNIFAVKRAPKHLR